MNPNLGTTLRLDTHKNSMVIGVRKDHVGMLAPVARILAKMILIRPTRYKNFRFRRGGRQICKQWKSLPLTVDLHNLVPMDVFSGSQFKLWLP